METGEGARLGTSIPLPYVDADRHRAVSLIISLRRARQDILGARSFGEPAWDIMLVLYEASFLGRPLSIATIGRRTNIKPSSMLRWVETLVAWDLAIRISDPHDRRTTRLALTAPGQSKLEAFVDLFARSAYDLTRDQGRHNLETEDIRLDR
jgi:DNA-binding MarR family transcriptional regulator